MLRLWVVESSAGRNSQLAKITKPLHPAQAKPDFISVKFAPAPSVPAADIRIELQHASIAIQIERGTTGLTGWVVRCNQVNQTRPRNDLVHLVKKDGFTGLGNRRGKAEGTQTGAGFMIFIL